MTGFETDPTLVVPPPLPTGNRVPRWLGPVVAVGLLVSPGCSDDPSSQIDGSPPDRLCDVMPGQPGFHESEGAEPNLNVMVDKICDTHENVYAAVVARYQSGEDISGATEQEGLAAPNTFTFQYHDDRTEHFVSVSLGLGLDGNPDLNNPVSIAVVPSEEVRGDSDDQWSPKDAEQAYFLNWDLGTNTMNFTTFRNGEEYKYDMLGVLSGPSDDGSSEDMWAALDILWTDAERVAAAVGA